MINLIYRLCENETDGNIKSVRPSWFSKEKCLKSFLNAVEFARDQIDKVIFVHDGPEGILFNQIPKEFEIVKIHNNNNAASISKILDVATDIGGNLYFIEDDYLHMPESISKIDIVLPELKLVTGYDHPSKYTDQYSHQYRFTLEKKNIFNSASNMNWQTSEFTCYTFAIEESTYKEFASMIRSKTINDIQLFVELNNRGVPLWSSIPGLATHVDTYPSPNVNWEELNSTIKL